MRETYDCLFSDDDKLFVVGTFDTVEEADEFAQQFSKDIKYLGAGRRIAKYELVRHIAVRNLAMTLAGMPGSTDTRRAGRVSRWNEDEPYGFIVDVHGVSWFVDRGHRAGPLDPEITQDSQVMFSGSPYPPPGQKYPQARTIRRIPWQNEEDPN